MKKIVIITVMLVFQIFSQAQTIVGCKGYGGEFISNTYIKDIDNDMNSFEGTYQYTNGNTTFRIQFVKKTSVAIGNHFEDLLIGEVRYKIGLQTVVNTLNNINTIYEDIYDHAIVGRMIIDDNNYGLCIDCTPNEIRISGMMFDGKRASKIWLQKEVINGQQALRVNIIVSGVTLKANQTETPPLIPGGEYIMLKQ